MAAVSRLPDACLLALFKQLPPEGQLTARTVCRKWNTLVPLVTSTRRSLFLILGQIDYDRQYLDYEPRQSFIAIVKLLKKEDGSPLFPPEDNVTIWNSIHYNTLPKNICHLIAGTFSGVNTLKVILIREKPKHLTLLLQLWRHQLITLQLIEYDIPMNNIIPADIFRLYDAINLLSHLKQLTLYLKSLPLGDLSVISHLEKLDIILSVDSNFDWFYDNQIEVHHRHLLEMLQKYGGSNENLVQVNYTGYSLGYKHIWERFTLLDGRLRQVFTRLDLIPIRNYDLSTVCDHFRSLTSLTVDYTIESYGLVALVHELNKLKQLVYLWLHININETPLPNAHHPLEQLISVKAFVLHLPLYLPQHLAALNIGWIFPNLQVFTYSCEDNPAFINADEFPGEMIQFAKECLRQLFRPLKRHFGRRLIIDHNLCPYYRIGSPEELLAAM